MSPTITKMEVWPVAGQDCMELNLSGAHAPYFTRNVVILYADNGETGVGEVPGGQKITKALEECIPLVVGTKVAEYKSTLLKVKKHLDARGEEDVRGNQTFDLRTGVHVLTAIEAPSLDLLGKHLGVPVCELLGEGQQRDKVRMLGYLFLWGTGIKQTFPMCLNRMRTASGTESAMRKPLRLIRLLHLQRQQRKSMDLRISS